MKPKSLSLRKHGKIEGATVLGPADFPLGSLQSRAAARNLLRESVREAAGDVYPPGWSPKTAAQKTALESTADILFFGGAAGSLKTETMLVDAARESGNPNLRAIIFRQQFTQMTDIVDKTHKLYKPMGATYVGQPSWTWTFPSDAKADSFWQILMLHGAIGDRWKAELLSYEAPTYFGMLCAAFTPPD